MKLNNLQIIGRIGQDAVIRDHQGRKFVTFSVAVDESYKDSTGQKVERTAWYDCNSEQERFQKIVQWLQKGREVFVEGKPSVRAYMKDGQAYGAIRIQIQNLSLGALPGESTNTGQATARTPAAAPAVPAVTAPAKPTATAFAHAGEDDNDLPF